MVRDSSGHLLLAVAKNLGFMEILVTEAMALRDGLLVVPNPEFQQLVVEGDSMILNE